MAAVDGLVDRYDVRLAVGLSAIPWPIPHTRPLGMVGLGVMGRSLALNLARHGFAVAGYDPHPRLPAGLPVALAESPAALANKRDNSMKQ